MITFRSFAAWLLASSVLAACASSEVTESQSYIGDETLARPERILVHDFVATPGDVPADSALTDHYAEHSTPQTQDEAETGRKLGAEVAKSLVAEIRAMGLPAVGAAGQPAPRVGDVVIRGYFVTLHEGDAGKRLLIGFGSGATELHTLVEGFQMTDSGLRPLGTRETEAAGGETPGLLVPVAVLAATGNPIGLFVGGTAKLSGEAGSETLDEAARRTAKEISQELESVFERQGWTQVAAAEPRASAPAAPTPQPVPLEGTQEGSSEEASPQEATRDASLEAPRETTQVAAVPAGAKAAFALQLASFKNPDSARQEWASIQGKFPKLLNDTQAVVQPATVEGLGTVYRLKAGVFPTRATAADFCAELRAAEQDCLVVER